MRAGCGRDVSSPADGGNPGGEGVSVTRFLFHVRYAWPLTTYTAACPASPDRGHLLRPRAEDGDGAWDYPGSALPYGGWHINLLTMSIGKQSGRPGDGAETASLITFRL